MHAHDRTQLTQRLGFQDPDKKEPRHDRACQFLTVGENMRALLPLWLKMDGAPACMTMRTVVKTALEVPLTKGSGQYMTTLGFIDVLTVVRRLFKHVAPMYERRGQALWCAHCLNNQDEYRDSNEIEMVWDSARNGWSEPFHKGTKLAVEVKIKQVPVADVLRQINFYRGYIEADWIVATAYDLSEVDAQTLASAKIKWVRLGTKFEEYVQQCAAAEPAQPVLAL